MLGILKAGGAFLPLDADLPAERVEYVLEDAKVRVLPHPSRRWPPSWPTGRRAAYFRWTPIGRPWRKKTTPTPSHVTTERNLAYAIYTSGLDRQAQGCLDRAPQRRQHWLTSFIRSYQVGPGDRVLQTASISFDVSVNEIFPALSTGADGGSAEQRRAAGPGRPVRLCPAVWRDHYGRPLRPHWRGSTSCPTRCPACGLCSAAARRSASAKSTVCARTAVVVNGYGPTEATICATSFAVPRHVADPQAIVPIGKPLANYTVFVVDRHLNCAADRLSGRVVHRRRGPGARLLERRGVDRAEVHLQPLCAG